MTNPKAFLLQALLASSLAACSTAEQTPTRLDTAAMPQIEANAPLSEAELQAQSLLRLSDDIVRRSTGRGAAIGAAVGCSLALVSKSSAKRCVTGALAGGATGAMIGHAKGKEEVKQRLHKVSPDDMARALRETDAKVAEIKHSLPQTLARQNAEVASLKAAHAEGRIPQAQYETRLGRIRAERAALADALTTSAQSANLVAQNLGKASANGQRNLMWHINKSMRLEEEATSARAQITLF